MDVNPEEICVDKFRSESDLSLPFQVENEAP